MVETLESVIARFGAETPDKIALVFDGRRMTYGEFAAAIETTARKLMTLGLQPGERVAIYSENSPEHLIALFAIWRAGGISASLYPSFGSSELCYALRNAEPRFALADADRIDALRAAREETGGRVEIMPMGPGRLLHGIAATPAALPGIDASAPALICYTSGTSSRPKPVLHSHAGLYQAAEAFAGTWRITDQDVSLVALPLAWLYGLITATASVLCRSGTVVIFRRFAAQEVLDALVREHVSTFVGVTTMYVKLLEEMARTSASPKLALRFCISGGEPRNEPVFETWRALTGRTVYDSYSGSESFPVVTSDPVADPWPPPGSSGRIVKGAEIKLIGPDGTPVAPGEPGEALTRGPALMLRYWAEPEMTRAMLSDDGWFRTRDYLRIDENGYVFVVGRASDMIIRGGANISPLEVEAVLNAFPSVQEAAVCGLPDERYGQTVAAAVVARSGATIDLDALRAFCVSKLAPYKVPTTIRIYDRLPRNESGKVIRRDIAGLFDAPDRLKRDTSSP
jgi:long-chain acyl-CoA synthetase